MINRLILNNKISIHLQPIVSIKNKKIFAFEALTRAYDDNNELISPLYLFDQARKENCSTSLDCYVRELALEKFKDYYTKNKELLLFLNFESTIIDQEVSDGFLEVVKRLNINPSNIVIEIKEDSVKDNNSLEKFVNKYRELGFVIAIDDFGTGYSSFDRLSLIKPDIVKIDRSLIYNINKNFINSEILSSISRMCHKIGAMILAEGVESKSEILNCLKNDIDIFQGFYFSKAKNKIEKEDEIELNKKVINIGESYKNILKNHLFKKDKLLNSSRDLTKKVLEILNNHHIKIVEKQLFEIIELEKKLEAIYIIEVKSGLQWGDTIINSFTKNLYAPTKENHDHSLKEYFFIAKNSSRGDYLSSKYISRASGNMCRTYSAKTTITNNEYIICFDILA